MKKNIITGLDIGSSKVCAAIAQIKEKGGLCVSGTGISKCSGISGGAVSDLTELADSISEALGMAEEKARLKPCNIIVNVGGPSVKGRASEGSMFFSSTPRVVTRREVNKVSDIARDSSIILGEDPIYMIPLGYTLDNQEGIENPLGLYGVKLKAKLYIITCASNLIRNIAKAVNHAGHEVKDFIYSGVALSHLLSEEEKYDGVALIDMGAHTTELAVFSKGRIRFNLGLGMGGADLTEEISTHFNISKSSAEELKLKYGTVYEQDLNIDERLTVDTDRRRVSIDRSGMNYVIASKIREIIASLKKGLARSGFQGRLPAGVVMSGTPLLMSGVVEMAEKEFHLPVRMGLASDVTADANISSSPAYATSIGLIKHGLNKFGRPTQGPFRKQSFVEKTIFHLKELLTDYF